MAPWQTATILAPNAAPCRQVVREVVRARPTTALWPLLVLSLLLGLGVWAVVEVANQASRSEQV